MSSLIAYTDGGCRGNPGPGGWAFVIYNPEDGKALERCGGEAETTNNRMEIGAAVEALKSLRKPGHDVLIHSDSQYLIKSASEWIPGWKARGWRRKDGPLANVDLLQELDRLLALHRVRWQWVKGHSGDLGNERVDLLANEAMDRIAAGQDPAWENRCTWPR
ncbi:MAG TPA: ribonuclease HI [Planctomycetota bacterium]|nr:ribonuclease HI [Planctomycetota bacterium]